MKKVVKYLIVVLVIVVGIFTYRILTKSNNKSYAFAESSIETILGTYDNERNSCWLFVGNTLFKEDAVVGPNKIALAGVRYAKDNNYSIKTLTDEELQIYYNSISYIYCGLFEDNTPNWSRFDNDRGEYVFLTEEEIEGIKDNIIRYIDVEEAESDLPFERGTLAYAILNSAMNNTDDERTTYRSTPLTIPAEQASTIYIKGEDPTTYTKTMDDASNYYMAYASDYTVDPNTGKLSLKDPEIPDKKYNTGVANKIRGKYLVANNRTAPATENLDAIYKVTTNIADITESIKYASIKSSSLPQLTEKTLSITEDDDGTSYYYRGDVKDNYVNFAGMCWRIVRIEGDGDIKLLLEDSTYECNNESYSGNWTIGNTIAFGYDSNTKADFLGYSGGLADALKTYQTVLLGKIRTHDEDNTKELSDYLKVDEWCYDHNVTEYKYWDSNHEETDQANAEYTDEYYGAYTRIYTNKQPSNICTGTRISKYGDNTTDMYVGTLTADEIAFAGADGNYTSNTNYYIVNTYAQNNRLMWWALSPGSWNGEDGNDSAFFVGFIGRLSSNYVYGDSNLRPAVTLKSETQISGGTGTQSDPYLIK